MLYSSEEIIRKIGEGVKHEREKNGFTQIELAEYAGLHYNYIGNIERGEKSIRVVSLYKICKALGISLSDFFKIIDL
ncbi:Helix-turn-helix [Carboxydocella sporoproducens DSM 16521]|uniref:Helix-turn-helix n=2 Tax=Carboxydocella TaxID=178898 RepID=A0A1T4MHV8_9FIRM|nr:MULTISPECIES: helix-turn-helix transcriptional regulator [Carboxydocella]AVX21339.1 helix-turn-helix protein [Carboxydocella thermautotrophica]SJZ66670.1 Helix-turn-helix [Carboxydocella sporoproducens DSM 16521]